jgi:hypothetical protein
VSNGHHRSTDGWVFPPGRINIAALAAATKQMTAPIAAAMPKAERKAGPDDAITGPTRAVFYVLVRWIASISFRRGAADTTQHPS